MVACVAERNLQGDDDRGRRARRRTSRSAFYEHFANKQACFLEAYEQMTSCVHRRFARRRRAAAEWREKLAPASDLLRVDGRAPEVAISTVVEVHGAGRQALEARARR